MKIALIRNSVHRGGGVERYVWLLARELDRRGHEVHLFARRCPELPAQGVIFHPVKARGLLSFFKVINFAREVEKALRGQRFDIVHSCDRILTCDIYRAGEGLHREWLRVSEEYLPPWKAALRRLDPLHFVLKGIEKYLIVRGGARRVTAISKKGAEEIQRHFGIENIPVIYNGVDAAEFSPPDPGEREAIRKEMGIPQDAFVVLYVGSGFFRKGLRYLIAGFSRLDSESGRPPWLVVAGRGAAGAYKRQARAAGVEGRTLFCGTAVPTFRLYHAADVFVLPTLYEPFGNVCLEALASGLPCIFSSRSGGAEIIEDGGSGLVLADPTDTDAIARLITRCMEPGTGASLGEKGRAVALTFTVAANADATERLYEEVMAEKGGLP